MTRTITMTYTKSERLWEDTQNQMESCDLILNAPWYFPGKYRRQQHWKGSNQSGMTEYSSQFNVTSEKVCVKIQQVMAPHEDLTIVKRHKLTWNGHVSRLSNPLWLTGLKAPTNSLSRLSGLAKSIMHGTVKGGRIQGRQKKGWEDNITEWEAWISPSPRGQWRQKKNGGNWLWRHLWCPNDPRV